MKARIGFSFLLLLTLGQARALTLPTPPQQNTDWSAPADVPTNMLSAANTLFAQGFPDPRGCQYREIEILANDIWERPTNIIATRGWTLPEIPNQPAFAIAWNGLIYPVIKLGAPADLSAELEDLQIPVRAGRLTSGLRSFSGVAEAQSVFLSSALSTRVLLLLRAGKTEAALKILVPDNQNYSLPATALVPPGITNRPAFDPYLQFASDWAWALFDRMINSHRRGDDAMALATARVLVAVQPQIESEAARRGFPRPRTYSSRGGAADQPYLGFLEQLPVLLTDLERREREGPRHSILDRGLTNLTNPTERIAALIHDLDLAAPRQMGQPGMVIAANDPLVAALIAEGDPAVEPLLDCMESDQRLTRAVGFGRDFHRSRTVLPVSSAARQALSAILQANLGNAADIRTYWKKYGHVKLPDRWFVILQDDSAGINRWLEAAKLIEQPTNQWRLPAPGFRAEAAAANLSVPVRGESLRDRTHPSVADLFARRALEISPTNLAGYDLSAATEMGLCLAAWDAAAARPVLNLLAERCRAALEYSATPRYGSAPPWGVLLARLGVARAATGDPDALTDYVNWLKTTPPDQLGSALAESIAPLGKFPTNTLLLATADELFGNTNSAWGRLPWSRAGFFNPVESDLIQVPAFRRLLVRELDDRTRCGYAEWGGPNQISFTLTNRLDLRRNRPLELSEDERPKPGAKAELRWCDWIAVSLASGRQIPPFNPFAPVEARDAAIAAAQQTLKQTKTP